MGIEKTETGKYRIIARVRVNGKIVAREITINGTKELAKAKLEELKALIRGVPLSSLKVELRLVAEIIDAYKDAPRKRGAMSEQYLYLLDSLREKFGKHDILQFPNVFDIYVRGLRIDKKFHAANRAIEAMRAAFNKCVELKLVKINPLDPAIFIETDEIPRDILLSPEEQDRIVLTAAKNRRTYHIARALQYCFNVPIRKSELINIKVCDVDIGLMAIRIYNGTTKNDRGQWKPIPPQMYKWILWRNRTAKSLDEPLFGRYVKASKTWRGLGDFKNAWDTVREETGYEDLHLHDTRHVSATTLIDNNTPAQIVQQIANWKTNMLEVYYNRRGKDSLKLVQFRKRQKCEDFVKTSQSKQG